MNEPEHSPLAREEYVEQAHFFSVLAVQMSENQPAQEVLASVREEVLSTTKLPLAIEFLLSELKHLGIISLGMRRLAHYFTPFQCFVMGEAESDRSRFDLRIGLQVLAKEAEYRAAPSFSRVGLFFYQLETICRNRLGYDEGLDAVAGDPAFDPTWREWLTTVRRQIGIVDLADLVYVRSEYYHQRGQGRSPAGQLESPAVAENSSAGLGPTTVLFGLQEGRIAWANRRKDPLFLFSALQRQLGYPQVPRPRAADPEERLLPVLARRVEQLEARLKLVEEEQRGGINLERFYTKGDSEVE